MKLTKGKVIGALAILVILAAAFWYGGNAPGLQGWTVGVRESSSPVLAVYLYVATSNYFLSLNIIRQYVAIGIGLVAVRFIRERRLLPFLICVAAAMFFHTTAVLLLPCYFLCSLAVRLRRWG